MSAQDAFFERWKELAGRQPERVKFTITATKTEFFFGEVIPLELKFTSTLPRTFLADSRLQDRVGRMNYTEEFVAAPALLCEDPLQGLPGGQGGMGGVGGEVVLSEKLFAFERVLNEWVRFRKPGEYRVYVVSRRVSQVEDPARSDHYLQGYVRGKGIELVSNILTLKLHPAPTRWVNGQIAEAKKILDAPAAPDDQMAKERRRAMRVLRFLDSLEAAEEVVRRLTAGQDVDSFSAYMGVLGSPYRKQLLPLMAQRLVAADQPVWERYLDALAQLAELVASGGPMPPYPKDASGQKAWQGESKRRTDVQEQKRNEHAARLIASLPSKQPRARAVSLNTLLSFGTRDSREPPWLRSVVASLITDFRSLPSMTQSMLLESRWSALKSPAILPVVRDLVANPPPQQIDPPIQSIALRRLYELSPGEGRKIILDEIREPTKNIPFSTLAMLPDAALPELNDVLVERFDALLILRYATGDIVKRVENAYVARNAEIKQHNLPTCAGPLAFYFLKYDPGFGERLLREDFDKPDAVPACYDMGFQFHQFGRWAYSPALERLAIDSLTSPKVPVKRGAAEVLGKYGTAAAEKPLWEVMEYFRSWWKGREEELKEKIGEESMRLEGALRTALAQADGWVLQEPELRRLLALCSSEWCRTDVTGWISTSKLPVNIGMSPHGDGFSYIVGQYGPGTDEWLRRKLAQYPEATAFQVTSWAGEAQTPGLREARERAETIVRASGRKLAQ